MGEFLLKYEDARAANSPEQAILDFCQSTYEAGAKLAHWDRQELERGVKTDDCFPQGQLTTYALGANL